MESQRPLSNLFTHTELPVAEVINPRGHSPVLLICEHASAAIPDSLHNLGLAPDDRLSHAAWDIGALDLARGLGAALDAVLVVSRVSRLVYDCNRPPSSPSAFPAKSELIDIPGNHALGAAEKAQRTREVYHPFQRLLAQTIASRMAATPPVLITIHSFTPLYFGQPRRTELGILHDSDNRLARAMLDLAPLTCGLRTEMNAPYDASDGVTHTLREHGLANGLHNVMLEIRNDLIDHPAGVDRVTSDLAELITRSLATLANAQVRAPRMSGAARAYIRIVDAINFRVGRIVMYGIFVMMGILLWSSISKTFFLPSLWTLEMAQFAMVAYYMLGGPYSIQMGSNVRMDLFYGNWSTRKKAWVDSMTVLFLIFYLVMLLWGGIDSTIYSFSYGGERSPTAWRPYLWPIKVTMCVGIFLMLLQAISELLKDVLRLRGKET